MIVGGFMSAVGILMSSFATDIYYLYFSYGIITGKSKEDVYIIWLKEKPSVLIEG